jgi:hypothetical protein
VNVYRFFATLAFALALMLTTATELRLAALPVGPGEVLLGLWSLAALLAVVLRGRVSASPVPRAVFYFWCLAFVLLSAGWTMAYLRDVTSGNAGHDAAAFLFTAWVTVMYAARGDAEERAGYTLQVMVGLTVCVLAFLFAWAKLVSPNLGPVNLWYSNRFAALSRNPNQLALLLCPVPFVAVYLYTQARGVARKAFFLSWVPVTLLIGSSTQSDALMVAWLGGAALAGVLLWLTSLRWVGRSPLRALLVYGVVPVSLLAVAAVYGPGLYMMAVSQSEGVYEYNNQGSYRLLLYANGLRAMSTSPFVGLGPGAHSGDLGPFNGSEAHNTFIDWGASTGILGVAAYVSLVGYLALRAWRARQPILLVAIATALAFSVFHYVMRHPVFWFYLMSFGLLSRAPGRQAVPRPVRPAPLPRLRRAAGVPALGDLPRGV